MSTIGLILFFAGILMALAGGILLIIQAFKESVIWGIFLIIFNQPIGLLFAILYWDRAKGPIFTQLQGLILMLVGGFMLGYFN